MTKNTTSWSPRCRNPDCRKIVKNLVVDGTQNGPDFGNEPEHLARCQECNAAAHYGPTDLWFPR